MWEIGQWIILVCVVLAFLVLIWNMAKLLFKAALVVATAAVIIFALNYFSLLPEEVQKYLREVISEQNVEKVRSWVNEMWSTEPIETADQQESATVE